MKLREEEFYEQYHQHGGTTIIPTEIFNELYDDATEEIERLNNIINELEKELINFIKETKLKWGNQLTDKGYLDIQITIKNYEDVLNKLQELKGSDKE